ncbi:hypothetical protein EYZ11_013122 [Aspergillus tanneri]|uniref:Uncharacterized protein n=1 Tax=Aspergillus tanneri TaxID=1220188 RepID=A0A4S3IYZ2_9EURO|nr:hypothetical protein EYZ11_013122 [Aspergillus tanneri]
MSLRVYLGQVREHIFVRDMASQYNEMGNAYA